MLINRFKNRMSTVKPNSDGKIAPSIAEFWFVNRLPNSSDVEQANWMSMSQTDRDNIVSKVTDNIKLFNSVNI
jgi:hypothetical protein